MKHWQQAVAGVSCSLGIAVFAIAPVGATDSQLISQGLQGQCRQVNQNTFIYRTRSRNEPLSALSADEAVILAEEGGQGGWIAVTSPTTGFVQAEVLKLCERANITPVPLPNPVRIIGRPLPPVPPSLPWPPPTLTAPLPPPNRLSLPTLPVRPARDRIAVLPGSCRLVTYPGPEGMTVRSGPGLNFPRVGGVAYQTRVETDPSVAHLDAEGRQWLKLLSPVRGWSSNGFPRANEQNFGRCP